MTTNERDLLRLINASIALGAAGQSQMAVQLTEAYLPDDILKKAKAILERMRLEDTESDNLPPGPPMKTPTPAPNTSKESQICPWCELAMFPKDGRFVCPIGHPIGH